MSLRDKIENDLAIWLIGVFAAGFTAGIGTYKTILEIAHLEVVSKSTLEKLESRNSPGSDVTPINSLALSSPEPERPIEKKSELITMRFSAGLPPFPENLDQIRPGMKLSEARTALPGGKLSPGWYSIDLETGPFSSVAFYTDSGGEDPTVGTISFLFRDEAAHQMVVTEVLRRFGGTDHKSEFLGARLMWPNINGFSLSVDEDSYQISSRR
jgi:hypothetical protein